MDTLRMPIPPARGPLSEAIIEVFLGQATPSEHLADLAGWCVRHSGGNGCFLADDDAQLSLLLVYELTYRGLDGVPDELEWDRSILGCRQVLEAQQEIELHQVVKLPESAADIADVLFEMTAPQPGPGVARYLASHGTLQQYKEFLVHRSIYHLKEADPHSWAIPRLTGASKAALIEIQCDEYGGGLPERMHQSLFAQTMRAVGLDDAYGRHVASVPGIVLSGTNTMSMFGLNRRLRGAIVGHLAAFEMTSSLPNRLYGTGLRRLGFGDEATRFFDEHVQADAVHEQIAGRLLAGGLERQEPQLRQQILFGAAACLALDDAAAAFQLASWRDGRSTLVGVSG